MNIDTRQRSRVGLLALACIFIAIGIGVVLGVHRLISDANWVSHSHEVIAKVETLDARVRDAESTLRGYFLTADPAYLANFRDASAKLPGIRDELIALVSDNPVQAARAIALWKSVANRLEQMLRTLQSYHEGGLPAAQAAISPDVITTSNKIRQQVAEMREAELRLLTKRDASTNQNANLLRALALLGIPFGLLVILVVFRQLVQEIRLRAVAEGESARSNDLLRIGLDRVERGRADFQALNHFGSMLQSCTSPEEALHLASRLLGGLLPGVEGCVYRIRNSQDHAERAVTWGTLAMAGPEMMPVNACWALRRGQSHATNAMDAARCVHFEAANPDVAATLCVPLVALGSQLGVLTLSAGEANAIDAHLNIIQTAAEQLAMALANLALQERLREQSIRDPLSGLFNRRYLEESVTRELSRCARRGLPLSLLMFDIDHFKTFNDVHGHAGGDAVLAQFGKLLKAKSRGEDIACRYGGEEFTLILPEADVDAASARAESIRLAVEAMKVPYLGALLPQVTVSIGVAGYPAHGDSADILLEEADKALYRAKRAGRNRVDIAIGV